MNPETLKERDARYDESKLNALDRKKLEYSFGLSNSDYAALKISDNEAVADIEEFVVETLAASYGREVPLGELEQAKAEGGVIIQATLANYYKGLQEYVVRGLQVGFGTITVGSKEYQQAITEYARVENVMRNMLSNVLEHRFVSFIADQRDVEMRYHSAAFKAIQSGQPVPDILTTPDVKHVLEVMPQEANGYNHLGSKVIRAHDWAHAAEARRYLGGEQQLFEKQTETDREVFVNPDRIIEELYSTLFLPMPGNQPMNVSMMVMGNDVSRFFTPIDPTYLDVLDDKSRLLYDASKQVKTAFDDAPSKTNWRHGMHRYEQYVRLMALTQAIARVPDITAAEIKKINDAFEELETGERERPAHYIVFAKRVFSGEFANNKRLFVDEMLQNIRTQPKEKISAE